MLELSKVEIYFKNGSYSRMKHVTKIITISSTADLLLAFFMPNENVMLNLSTVHGEQMNKYQKALNSLLNGKGTVRDLRALKELADKATPKQPKKSIGGVVMTCPDCDSVVGFDEKSAGFMEDYCANCGQKLDWNNDG